MPFFQQLPEPPPDKCRWPWDAECGNVPPAGPEGAVYPRITVVTPSYNQAEFLEETLRSVLLQHYPNLEYIVIDGGSTDGSVDILKKYDRFVTSWVSEPDKGQSHAINKGFARSRGEILCWLNSDDMLAPGALARVAGILSDTSSRGWLIGSSNTIDRDGHCIGTRACPTVSPNFLFDWPETWFPQQSTFWTRPLWEAAGPLDENLHYVMDLALWLAMFDTTPPICVPDVLSYYRFHEAAKCSSNSAAIPQDLMAAYANYFHHHSQAHRPNTDRALYLGEKILYWARESYNTQHVHFRNDLIRIMATYLKDARAARSFGAAMPQKFGREILFWARDAYHRHQYHEARRYLAVAIRICPRLLLSKADSGIIGRVMAGGKLLKPTSTVKKFFLS